MRKKHSTKKRSAILPVGMGIIPLLLITIFGSIIKHGGSESPKVENSGYWHIESVNKISWLVSPEGNKRFVNLVNCVQPTQEPVIPNSLSYISSDYAGDEKIWAKKTAKRITDYGFDGAGCWSNKNLYDVDVNFAVELHLWSSAGTFTKVFSPLWLDSLKSSVREKVVPLANNKKLVGYFTDNELPWSEDLLSASYYFNNTAPTDPNKAEVIRFIRQSWETIEYFNSEWETSFKSFEELALEKNLPETGKYKEFNEIWMEHVARQYFQVTHDLIKEVDPHHLILGVRFNKRPPLAVIRGSRDYIDAHSINVYDDEGRVGINFFEELTSLTGKPVFFSEISFYSPDNNSGNKNTKGFGGYRPTQLSRAESTGDFIAFIASNPNVIGIAWFQYNDEPPMGRIADGEDCNFGVVDITDKPYSQLVNVFKEYHLKANNIHQNGTSPKKSLWKSDNKRLK